MKRPADLGACLLLACGGGAALLYSNFLLDWTRRGFVGMDDIVSQLEAAGQPHAVLLRATDVVCAVLVVALLPWVRLALPRGPWREVVVWSTVLFALGATVAAFVPPPCGPDVACSGHHLQIAVHDGSSIASDALLYVGVAAAWFATRRSGPVWFHRAAWWVLWVGGVLSSVLFEYFNVTDDPDWAVGAAQRVHIVCISGWILCLAYLAAAHRRPSSTSSALRPLPSHPQEHDHARRH
jgi:hypothetical protein